MVVQMKFSKQTKTGTLWQFSLDEGKRTQSINHNDLCRNRNLGKNVVSRDRRTDGRTGRWTDGRTNSLTDRWTQPLKQMHGRI